MGNWVIICHGGPDNDRGTIVVPEGTDLQFWVNEGQPARVGAALLIITELRRNPVDVDTLQSLIDRTPWGSGVRWDATSGTGGQGVQSLILHGDPDVECVGVLDLSSDQFDRWGTTTELTLGEVLRRYPGNVHLICCR